MKLFRTDQPLLEMFSCSDYLSKESHQILNVKLGIKNAQLENVYHILNIQKEYAWSVSYSKYRHTQDNNEILVCM